MIYFSIDGIQWNYPCTIKREAKVTPSEISGMLLDRTYFNDVIGTWMQYDIALAIPLDKIDDYTAIYEKLTDPVDAHTFILPYNSGTVTITGRVESVQDAFVRLGNDVRYWKGIGFSIIADHPTKYYSLSTVVTRGREPFPESASLQYGDLWELTADGWVVRNYPSADEKYY